MSVMDIQSTVTRLTDAQLNLAHGMKHTTMANVRTAGGCSYPVVALHYDLVETAVIALGITGQAAECFRKVAQLPSELVAEYLK